MMKKLVLLLLVPMTLFGHTKKALLEELHFIKGVFEVKYAPFEWKRSYSDFDLDQKVGEAAASIEALPDPSLQDYHHVLKRLFNAAKDYHVGVHFYATEEAILPFQVKGAEGRFFFVNIDRSCLPYSKFPFSIGDELLSFGGQPVSEVITDLRKREFGGNTDKTDQALAEMLLTQRRASFGDLVPSGPIEIIGLKKGQKKPRSCNLEWYYYPERVKGIKPVVRSQPNFAAWRLNPRETVKNEKFFERLMIFAGWHGSHVGCSLAENGHALGARSSFVPKLGRKIWSSKKDAIYDAYIFQAGDQNIGYIRIPHYMADEDETEEFCETMKFFQRSTQALVIDQVNNPGGSLFYLYSLVAALTKPNETIAAPKHCMKLTQEEVYMAISILEALDGVTKLKEAKEVFGDTLGGYPLTMEMVGLMRQFCDFLLDQWAKGEIFTKPTHLFGVDEIRSHPDGIYTKPVLVLTNELDFSGGDIFPATLQDAGRATILGTRTAGAGGFVNGMSYPNRHAVAHLQLTGSIAERATPQRQPIENLGVQPDIEYELTAEDLTGRYEGYVQKIVESVLSLI